MILLVGKTWVKILRRNLKCFFFLLPPRKTLRKEKLEQDKLTFKTENVFISNGSHEKWAYFFGRFECNCLKLLHSERIWKITEKYLIRQRDLFENFAHLGYILLRLNVPRAWKISSAQVFLNVENYFLLASTWFVNFPPFHPKKKRQTEEFLIKKRFNSV